MPRYLYIFGFESPRQFRNNHRFGWDDEDSQGVVIDAEDEVSAIEWGQQVSEAFLKLLFQDQTVSWAERKYANWIESPDESWPGQQCIALGEFPDFTDWLRPYIGEE